MEEQLSPQNEAPVRVNGVYETVAGLLSSYGWTILFVVVLINLLWSHFYPKWKKWRERMEDQRINQEYQQNPEAFLAREEGLRRARQKMQQEHDRLAQEHAEKIRQQEEEKRQEKIRVFEQLQSGKSLKKTENKSQSLRSSDFNPLAGSSGGSCYRPSHRSGASGGG